MIHQTSDVHPSARLGRNVRIWNWVQVRQGAEIGENTIISKSCYVDAGVHIGANSKIQNNVSIYHGVTIENGVFVGPHVCFTNDKRPRAINPDGSPKSAMDWVVSTTLLRYGCSVGANATITPGITIGKFAMIGAGAVVTRDVPDYGLALGCPARLVGYVCPCGERLVPDREGAGGAHLCLKCGKKVIVESNV